MGGGGEGPVAGEVPENAAPVVYSAISSVDVQTWASSKDGFTVIVLDGLEEIPSSVDLLKTTASVDGDEWEDDAF
jgi:hypothetical protein